jgi:hypothetical protein
MLDTIALKFALKVAMIFIVSFDIIIQRAVGNEPYYLIKKKPLITTALYNRSGRNNLHI